MSKPKMQLIGQDGNIFAILGRARQLLRECGQSEQVTEMTNRVHRSGSYEQALMIISEYVETELTGEKIIKKHRHEPER